MRDCEHHQDRIEMDVRRDEIGYQHLVCDPLAGTDAGFVNPEVYEFLEDDRIKYAIRLPANRILQERIGYLLMTLKRFMAMDIFIFSKLRPFV
jgi:hypothetical protein